MRLEVPQQRHCGQGRCATTRRRKRLGGKLHSTVMINIIWGVDVEVAAEQAAVVQHLLQRAALKFECREQQLPSDRTTAHAAWHRLTRAWCQWPQKVQLRQHHSSCLTSGRVRGDPCFQQPLYIVKPTLEPPASSAGMMIEAALRPPQKKKAKSK